MKDRGWVVLFLGAAVALILLTASATLLFHREIGEVVSGVVYPGITGYPLWLAIILLAVVLYMTGVKDGDGIEEG